jgi:Family of unknown function (DUF5684)
MWFLGQTEDFVDVTTTTYTTDVDTAGLAVFAGVWLFFWLALVVIAIIAMWKIFTKAGEAGWKSIIPIYNTIVMLKIVGRPWWWILLLFIPLVNIVVWLVLSIDLGKSFGKDAVFSVVLLFFLSLIGMLILGFGDAKYVGPGGSGSKPAPEPAA